MSVDFEEKSTLGPRLPLAGYGVHGHATPLVDMFVSAWAVPHPALAPRPLTAWAQQASMGTMGRTNLERRTSTLDFFCIPACLPLPAYRTPLALWVQSPVRVRATAGHFLPES